MIDEYICNECSQRSFVGTRNINFILIYITYMPIYGITYLLGRVGSCMPIFGKPGRLLLPRCQHWLTLSHFLHPGSNPVKVLPLKELLNCNLPSINTRSLVALLLLLLVLVLLLAR